MIEALENSDPGTTHATLRLIETQRIYQKSDVAIVYTIVPTRYSKIIVLHTVNVYEHIDFLGKFLLLDP